MSVKTQEDGCPHLSNWCDCPVAFIYPVFACTMAHLLAERVGQSLCLLRMVTTPAGHGHCLQSCQSQHSKADSHPCQPLIMASNALKSPANPEPHLPWAEKEGRNLVKAAYPVTQTNIEKQSGQDELLPLKHMGQVPRKSLRLGISFELILLILFQTDQFQESSPKNGLPRTRQRI